MTLLLLGVVVVAAAAVEGVAVLGCLVLVKVVEGKLDGAEDSVGKSDG